MLFQFGIERVNRLAQCNLAWRGRIPSGMRSLASGFDCVKTIFEELIEQFCLLPGCRLALVRNPAHRSPQVAHSVRTVFVECVPDLLDYAMLNRVVVLHLPKCLL